MVYKGKEVFLVLFSARPGQNEGEMATVSHWEPFILLRLSFACLQAPTKMFSMTLFLRRGGKTPCIFAVCSDFILHKEYIICALLRAPKNGVELADKCSPSVFCLVKPYAIRSLASPFTAILCLSPERQTDHRH